MIRFVDLPSVWQGLIGLLIVAQFFYAVMHAVMCFKRKNRVSTTVLTLEIGVLYLEFQFIAALKMNKHGDYPLFHKMVQSFVNLPVLYILLFFIFITITEAMQSVEYRVWKKNNITASSVKEALDDLPAGICCYEENGRILLKNRSMERICRSLTGRALLNGNIFQKVVWENRTLLGNGSALIMPENVVYSITEEVTRYDDRDIHVLITMDITEQYAKMQSLVDKQQDVQKLNEQLTTYGKEIVSVITAKEILNAKVKLHDELGLNLLATKKYILNGGTKEELEEIKEGLMQNIQYLRHESIENESDEYKIIMETAKKLNVKIQVQGEFPKEEPVKHILVTAIHECLTNTIRHAHGNEMTVKIQRTERILTAMITNNGEAPSGKIDEKGGLASLRTLVENNKGRMTIRSEGKFILIIDFPSAGCI